ncbi:MAG: diaminopimelate epimerase, partial [Bacteroidales bacterium]|nr:diaminopimelate epimerase [Bacteroidales bacterium]
GRALADDSRFAPERTNVNFVEFGESSRLRTYERGVEGETFACGTGTVATALCINYKYNVESPIVLNAKGGKLKVYFEKNGKNYRNIWLEGGSNYVFRGEKE